MMTVKTFVNHATTGEVYIFEISKESTAARPFATVNSQSSNKKVEIAINS